jgi:hypothetical protein
MPSREPASARFSTIGGTPPADRLDEITGVGRTAAQ